MMNCMFVITHKEIDKILPANYQYFYVNSIKSGYLSKKYNDAMCSDNISIRNYSFCELTALYEFPKFSGVFENIGLSHYRRFFVGGFFNLLKQGQISTNKLDGYLEYNDIILPFCLRFKNDIYDHFQQHHNIKDLDKTVQIVAKIYPDYEKELNKFLKMKKMVCFNMFYCRIDFIREYINWLFPILFEVEQTIDISTYDSYQKRIFGFLAERLFNVWLLKNKPKVKYLHVNFTDWTKSKQIFNFVWSLFFRKRYYLF